MNTVYIKSPSGKTLCRLTFIQPPITVQELIIRAHWKIDSHKGPRRGDLNVDHLTLRPIYWPDTKVLVPSINAPLHLCNEYILDTAKKMQSFQSIDEPENKFPWLFYVVSCFWIFVWYIYIYL